MNKLFIINALFFSVFIGCKNAEQIAKGKAKKEYIDRQKEILQREEFRNKYPCDTITKFVSTIDTVYQEVKVDTFINGDTVQIVRYQQQVKNIERLVYVIDQAAVKNARDSVLQIEYQLSQITELANKQQKEIEIQNSKIKESNTWMWRAVGTWVVIGILFGVCVFYYIKIK